MPSWSDVEAAAPELAAKVRERLDARVHKTIRDAAQGRRAADLRDRDDLGRGGLWVGSMWQGRKARDLLRDPRFALHSGSDDPPANPADWPGDAKLAGRAVAADEATIARVVEGHDEHGRMHLFRLDLTEATWIGLDEEATLMVIESWTPEHGVRTITR